MKYRGCIRSIGVSIALSLIANFSALASPTITTDQTTFNTATSGLDFWTESFDGILIGPQPSNPEDFGPFSVFSPISVNISTSQCVAGECLVAGFGFDPTITFDTPVYAVSFTLGDILDSGGGEIRLSVDGGMEKIVFSSGNLPGNVQLFVGIYDLATPFTSFKVRNTDTNDAMGLDNLSWGKIPEPTPLAILGLGLAGLGVMRRRRAV